MAYKGAWRVLLTGQQDLTDVMKLRIWRLGCWKYLGDRESRIITGVLLREGLRRAGIV